MSDQTRAAERDLSEFRIVLPATVLFPVLARNLCGMLWLYPHRAVNQ